MDRPAPPVAAGTVEAPVYRGDRLLGAAPHLRRDVFGTLVRAAALGPVVRFRMPPGVPIRSYGVFTPDAVQRVLVSAAEDYRKDSLPYRETAAAFGNGLLTSQDADWHRQRRFVGPMFSPRRLEQDYVPILRAEAEHLRDRWLAAPDAVTDVHAASVRYTFRAVGRVLFGSDLDALLPTFGPTFADLNVYLRRRITAAIPIPASWPTPVNRRGHAARRALYGMVEEIVAARRACPRGAGDDLLGRLLAAQDADGGAGMSAAEVRDQVLVFLLAGHETTSTMVAFALQYLARHPDVQCRVAAEAATAVEAGRLTGQVLRAMPYTQQVLRETVRLRPPAFAVSRYTHTGDVVDGVPIPAGSNVAVGTWAIHRDPRWWPDPERFDPDRFTPDSEARRHRYAWLPFGAGPRICIGAQLSMIEATIALGVLTARHRIILAPGDPSGPGGGVGAVPAGLVLRPAAPMYYRLLPAA